jgi:two-component system LytT family response regulator
MNILIIEDEPLVAKDIHNLVLRLEPDASIVAILSSVEESRKWLSEMEGPDLILSDIQLSDGTCFEIFENMNLSCPIIFTTAYDAYAIRAFKLNSIDYLLKPIDAEELSAALRKYKTLVGRSLLDVQVKSLIQQWGKGNKYYKERFLVLHGSSLVPVMQSDIAFFHKDQLIFLHTMKEDKFICEYHALDDVEDLLDPQYFFRVNRQYIIHVQAVAKVKTTHKGLSVILKGNSGIEIDISREKATAFKKWLG